jgi:ornithine cyclodeaminase
MTQAAIRIIELDEIRRVVSAADALAAVRTAYAQLASGKVEQPEVIGLELKHTGAEVHAKGAYIQGAKYFTIKIVGNFPENLKAGRPNLAGSVFVFNAHSGELTAILRDNGLLTELRTAAAGALSAELLARNEPVNVAVIGTGNQARSQIAALVGVRSLRKITIFGRTRSSAEGCARELRDLHRVPVDVASNIESAVQGADIVITVTAAREPLIQASWIGSGTHVIAVGADMPGKQELDPKLLARAKLVVDRYEQCATQGELQHALAASVLTRDGVYAEIGDIVLGKKPGRTSPTEITVADFTGVGALDAAMANLVLERLS